MAREYVPPMLYLPLEYKQMLRRMPSEQVKSVLIALMEYTESGEEPSENALDPIAFAAFDAIRPAVDRNLEGYQKQCEAGVNGKKGGRPRKNPKGYDENPKGYDENPKGYDETLSPLNFNKNVNDNINGGGNTAAADAALLVGSVNPDKPHDVFAEFAGDDTELLSTLKDFEQMRNRIKKPLTDKAKKILCTELQKNFKPGEWVPALEQSILNNWKSVYPLENSGNPPEKEREVLR